MKQQKKSPFVFFAFYFVIFLTMGISGSFLTLFLSDAGMKTSTIGLINGMIQALSLAVYPLWGLAADRARTKNRVLIFELFCIILVLMVFTLSKSLVMLGIMTILYSLVNNPIHGIYESITMEHVRNNGWNYSPIRMSGTIGYAIMAAIAGFCLTRQQSLLFPLLIGTEVAALFFACLLPKTKAPPKPATVDTEQKSGKNNVYIMLKNKNVLRVLILFGIYSMVSSFNMTYYGIYVSSLGGNYTVVGISHMIMALSEIPFHIGPGRRWMQRLGVEKCLLMVMGVGVVRWTICALTQSVTVLMLTMAFNGIMVVPTVVGLVEFLYENAPDHLKASAQTALRAPFQVGGQLMANVVGGGVIGALDAIQLPGIRVAYALLAPICLISALVFGIPLLREDRRQAAAVE